MKVTFGYNTNGRFPRLEKKLRWVVNLPLSFSDLNEADLLFLGRQWPFRNDIAFQTRFLFHRCQFKNRPLFGLLARMYLKSAEDLLYTIISNQGKPMNEWPLAFLSEEPNSEKTIIRTITLHGAVYHTFSDGLRNISINEFAEAEKYLEHIITSGTFEALENLVAVLFRPEFTPFDILDCHARAVVFTDLPQDLKIAVYLQYRAQRHFMISANKAAFRKTGKKNSGPKNTWKDIVQDLAHEFVNVYEVGTRPAWEVFSWLAHSTKRQAELKSKIKSKK